MKGAAEPDVISDVMCAERGGSELRIERQPATSTSPPVEESEDGAAGSGAADGPLMENNRDCSIVTEQARCSPPPIPPPGPASQEEGF